jgi:hypothetical protein
MNPEQLAAAGIPTELPAAEKAAAVVRAFPLRFSGETGHRDLSTVVESRWLAGTSECLRLLSGVYRGTPGRGTAFGTSWPLLSAGGRLVAPALPVVAGRGEGTGPDGSYELRAEVVWREAVGEWAPFLSISGAPPTPGAGFDLLWFGSAERYLLRAGMLEVEDLFSVLRVPATTSLIDRLLIRGQRIDPEALEGVPLSDSPGSGEVEVRRSIQLLPEEAWRDPRQVLAVRTDLRHVERQGDQLVAETALEDRVVFNVVGEQHGWRVYTWEGEYPFRTLRLIKRGQVLVLSGALNPDLDPFTPGLRGRLAFDLRSDLVALGEQQPHD